MTNRRAHRRTSMDKAATLADLPFLAHCSREEREVLAGAADECLLPAGHVLMWEGDRGTEAFVILEGTAEVAVAGEVVAVVGRGQTVGEMALIDRRPRSATVVARSPMRVLVVGNRHLGALVGQAGVARGLLEVVTARLRNADERAVVPAEPVG
ncbi:MAG TPA: cyclic nucleotide-binding domain-containing protein [Acidimicrobiales bacterium]|nr:cyclic nucleotide-binding domain-containing protein [Acidimicrobiales bacterium]